MNHVDIILGLFSHSIKNLITFSTLIDEIDAKLKKVFQFKNIFYLFKKIKFINFLHSQLVNETVKLFSKKKK